MEADADNRRPFFVECMACSERWKVATLLVSVEMLGKLSKRLICPNCYETKRITMCCTEGEHAVTEPRLGRLIERK